jgi:endonuclease I
MNIKSLLLFAATLGIALSSNSINAQVSNGTFETWSNGNPADWSTIDSGIMLDQVTNPTVDGDYAAKVTVVTASQASTDFRQNVQVEANKTYNFQVSVYHTEGNVAARLYVDGYRGYSDNSVRNQWQQISYTYQATQTKTISVGTRFYDRSGFDGSEVVYLDSFQPTDPIPAPPTPIACTDTTVTLNTDNYGSETSWQLRTAAGTTIGGGSNLANNRTYTDEFCLNEGDYNFVITDAYGDGICCQYGQGSYSIATDAETLASGGQFGSSETKTFTIAAVTTPGNPSVEEYYQSAAGLTGLSLKTALHNIIKGHSAQGYGALWGFYAANSLDVYYENDGSILDIYSENPNGTDAYTYTAISDQCGSSGFNGEGDCYNREHSFPRSWFGGDIEPMNSDVHFIFASDGQVNSLRSSFPYGNVGSVETVSNNGSKKGSAASGSGYSGTVFEPNDEFKGDVARAALYVATRYENIIAGWESNTQFSDAVLNGGNTVVFETWYINLLKQWHQQDPVCQKEIDRNNAAQTYQ